jgi:hypothetical protein
VKHPRTIRFWKTSGGKKMQNANPRKPKQIKLSQQKAKTLYGMLPIGSKNAISRKELSDLWGLSDRTARIVIAELRKMDFGDSYIIVSYSDGKGYYRTDDIDEIEAFAAEMRSRALNIFAPLRKANRIIREFGTQSLDFESA